MAEPARITAVTVNYNTSDFIELMVEAFERLSEAPVDILVCDNGSEPWHLLKLVELEQRHPRVRTLFRRQSKAGSIGHAEAMDLLVARVETPHFVTMDADATFLRKHWDRRLLELLDDQVKVVGTPAVAGVPKPTDFPCVYAVLYETAAFRELGCSFMPVEDQILQGKDTGYDIREKMLARGYRGKNLRVVNTRSDRSGPYGDILCAEYYLDDDPDIFACHFSRGSTAGDAKYKDALSRLPYLGPALRKYRGQRDRRLWIERSRNLIAAQLRR